ncbi:uncharacterized protein LOC125521011 [Triticum urartu]|uniref:Uncharacterized protein n=1 Tax=Triticum urartu TaxID=4572 RepID=A0A8R7QYJ7_TRIUA|nr:uncharacterized protein LOC119330708 [Triticum dicoccoides]XP_048542014.1 uncharacterized protein LOC125521011 [Triticum urartu]
MQQAKVKVKDGASALRAKAKIVWAKLAEKTEAATSRSHDERQLAHERGRAKVAAAEAQLHQEKVAHREAAMEHRLHKHAGVGGHNHKHGAGGVH